MRARIALGAGTGALVLAAIAAAPAAGQAALTVGRMPVDFTFGNADSSVVHRFDGVTTAVALSGQTSSLTVAFGRSGPSGSRRQLVDVALALGGNASVFDRIGGAPIGAFVPVRLNVGYRNLAASEEDGRLPDTDALRSADALHLASAGLGVGAGARVRVPTGLPALRDRLVAFGSVVWGAGAATDVATGVDDASLMGSRDLNLEVRFERALGDRIGVALGYTMRRQYWGPVGDRVRGADVRDAFLRPGDLPYGSRQHLLRLGITF